MNLNKEQVKALKAVHKHARRLTKRIKAVKLYFPDIPRNQIAWSLQHLNDAVAMIDDLVETDEQETDEPATQAVSGMIEGSE